MKLSNIETLASRAHCPTCGSQKSLVTYLNCSSSDKNCNVICECGSCKTKFEVEPSIQEDQISAKETQLVCSPVTHRCEVINVKSA